MKEGNKEIWLVKPRKQIDVGGSLLCIAEYYSISSYFYRRIDET